MRYGNDPGCLGENPMQRRALCPISHANHERVDAKIHHFVILDIDNLEWRDELINDIPKPRTFWS